MPGFPRLKDAYDLVILGGGHAGLQAGLKCAMLNHSACVIDRGPKYSRSYYAPKMDNIPGFPDGISGHELLDRQILQVRAVDPAVGLFSPARVTGARRLEPSGYRVEFDWLGQKREVTGRALVLALGVVDRILEVGGSIQPIFPWANFGIVDFCVFCDGHTLAGKTVAVLGHDAFAALTALDLGHFGVKAVEILTHGRPLLGEAAPAERDELLRKLSEAGVTSFEEAVVGFDGIREKRFGVTFAGGSTRTYDKGFSALGWFDMHDAIPRSLGTTFDPDGYVVTDEDCRALGAGARPIPGLYCVGDLRNGWNQIPEAWATAERAVLHAYSYYL
ncbi:MAG: NAD(P)/FAD-dependent oxidoreductase [Thermoplasmata archaeon]|nr:NAD(P)/FAD-dependent oxidoreductase [Thermoplasmata archaeon]MCI4359518.1 NAD(P)/FAD-dependent oxidoreductase [Thermoplasmata archaeon]